MTTIEYRQPTYAATDVDGAVEAVHRDGCAMIPGVLTGDEIARARALVDELEPIGFDRQEATYDHYKCIFNRDPFWLSFLDRPGVIDLAERLMGPQCHIIGMTAWRTRPGYPGQGLHADRLWVRLPSSAWDEPDFRLPVYIATAHFYLQDMGELNSPTKVIRGSHRSGTRPDGQEQEWNGESLEPVICAAGDAFFFRSEVWHRGSRNRSDETRYLIQVHYAERDIAQKFSPWPFHFDPEILAAATPRQRRILGEHPESAYG